jgi:acetyl esterase/lipase
MDAQRRRRGGRAKAMSDSERPARGPILSDLHPDLRGGRFAPLPFHNRWFASAVRTFGVLDRVASVAGVTVEDRNAPPRVRVYEPDSRDSDSALLWMHGGGLIVGTPAQDDDFCSHVARSLGILVVSVYYRLAPKDPYPAAIDDCLAAWHWLQAAGDELGVDRERVAIGGASAGGGLAACLTQRIFDEGGVQPRAQVLVYPMLDDRTALQRDLDGVGHLVWTNRANRYGWSSYLGGVFAGQDTPPYAVAARRESLSGLPPAWIGVGTLDLFLDECRQYAQRLLQDGTACTLLEVPGAPHGFASLAPEASVTERFVAAQVDFLGDRFSAQVDTRGPAVRRAREGATRSSHQIERL